jgi:hypothetical protein
MWAARPTVEAFHRHSSTETGSARLLSASGHEAPASPVLGADKVVEEQLISAQLGSISTRATASAIQAVSKKCLASRFWQLDPKRATNKATENAILPANE